MTTAPKNQSGYIALIALLIVAAAGLTIGIAVSLSGIEELQLSFASTQAAQARSLAYTCAEDGLERLRNNFVSSSDSLSINGDSCIIDIVVSGSSATIDAIGTVGLFNQKIHATVNGNLEVINWQEE